MTWQTIDTAPKDGTEFLAYDAAAKKFDVCQMIRLGNTWDCWPVQADGEYGPAPGEFGYESGAVTHWQPLPEPPTDDKAA